MSWALFSSAGKDCTLALDRARRSGKTVETLVTICDGSSGRVGFHGTRSSLVEAHALAFGLRPLIFETGDDGFEPALDAALQTLTRRGYEGVVFGNIHLSDVRAWYEERVVARGLRHEEPLWNEDPADLLLESIHRGFRSLVVSVNLEQPAVDILGHELDSQLARDILATPQLDPCGEKGEYHTFVFDGPGVSAPVRFGIGETVEMKGHRFLDLEPV